MLVLLWLLLFCRCLVYSMLVYHLWAARGNIDLSSRVSGFRFMVLVLVVVAVVVSSSSSKTIRIGYIFLTQCCVHV